MDKLTAKVEAGGIIATVEFTKDDGANIILSGGCNNPEMASNVAVIADKIYDEQFKAIEFFQKQER